MTSEENSGDKSDKDVELNDAFEKLERQVAENQKAEAEAAAETKPEQPEVKRQPRPQRKAAASEKPTGGSGFVGVVGLLFALIALGLGSYSAYTTWQMSQQLNQQQNQTNPQVTNLTTQLDRIKSEFASLRSGQGNSEAQLRAIAKELSAAQTDSLEQVQTRVSASIAELRQQIGTTSEDWLLAEAEYLLRIANQRVVMEGDVKGAIALFEAADEIIADAEGVVAFSLRAAIAADIAALRAVSAVDTEGVYVQLAAISKQIPALELQRLQYEAKEVAPLAPIENPTLTQRLTRFMQQFIARVLSLVDYRKEGEIITPMLPPEEEYYLKQNLMLKLQLAQLGLLRGNQDIYDQSLIDAANWVERHFDLTQARTTSVIAGLQTLAGQTIVRDLPDVSASLREIRRLMSNFQQAAARNEVKSTPEPVTELQEPESP